jgi:hypothetical protein
MSNPSTGYPLGIDETIRSLAFQHGILGVRQASDPWADDLLGVPRKPLDTDTVCKILAALQKRGAVTFEQASKLERDFAAQQSRLADDGK